MSIDRWSAQARFEFHTAAGNVEFAKKYEKILREECESTDEQRGETPPEGWPNYGQGPR